jgi:hypothetical protein
MIANTIAGILAPAQGAVVTGGTLYTSGGFNYRVFTGNGSLVVSGGSISADVLVIAGGASGGNYYAGAGGAGGVCYQAGRSLTPATYSITV